MQMHDKNDAYMFMLYGTIAKAVKLHKFDLEMYVSQSSHLLRAHFMGWTSTLHHA